MKNTYKKLHADARNSKFMSNHKRRVTMKAFITSGCCYYQWVWMFHSGKLNNWINKLHETALRIIYQDDASSYTELFEKYNSATIHNKNIQLLNYLKQRMGYHCLFEQHFCGKRTIL